LTNQWIIFIKKKNKLEGILAATLTLKKWILLLLILLLPMIPTFWAIIDLFKVQTRAIYTKFFWLMFVIFIPCLGGLCYLLFGRRILKKKGA